jgi:hypothetical protein
MGEKEAERPYKMMSIPKSLEGLFTNLTMSGSVHEKHQ